MIPWFYEGIEITYYLEEKLRHFLACFDPCNCETTNAALPGKLLVPRLNFTSYRQPALAFTFTFRNEMRTQTY